MITIPGGMYLSPADLGLLDVQPAAAGGIVTGKWLDWTNKFPIRAVGLISEHITNNGATTIDAMAAARIDEDESFVTTDQSGLWAGHSNNPRTQYAFYNLSGIGNVNGVATTGTSAAGELAKLFSAPQIRFSLRNNHATLVDTLRLHAIVWFKKSSEGR